jgi:hypothetical protein
VAQDKWVESETKLGEPEVMSSQRSHSEEGAERERERARKVASVQAKVAL